MKIELARVRSAVLAALLVCPLSAQAAVQCARAGVTISSDFATGAMAGCDFRSDSAVRISIEPELEPINPSPWYSVAITTSTATTLAVTLDYGDYRHRYSPDLQLDGGLWAAVDAERVTLSEDGTEATVSLTLPAGSHAILAGQPILDVASYEHWIETLPSAMLTQASAGESREGRPLWRLTSAPRPQTLLLLGRQHPPETTGAEAMRFFVERLLADDALASAFRSRVSLLIYPLLNPDGVEAGHWRLNRGGVDLNRDWGPFTQPETRQVAADIAAQLDAHDSQLIKVIDFHSTRRDVFYTQEDDTATVAPDLLPAWLAAFENQLRANYPDFTLDRSANHNPTRPTAKSFFSSRYGVAATTLEMADSADTDFIRDYAVAAAESLMRAWPEDPR